MGDESYIKSAQMQSSSLVRPEISWRTCPLLPSAFVFVLGIENIAGRSKWTRLEAIMYKFEYITSSADGKANSKVSADFVAMRISSRTIGMIALGESGTTFSFGLSDGGHVRFELKQDKAEVTYSAPREK
jgi:hypothetical protein